MDFEDVVLQGVAAVRPGLNRAQAVAFVAGELGVTGACVQHWLAGRRTPDVEDLDRIARLLGWNDAERGKAARLLASSADAPPSPSAPAAEVA